VHAGFWWGSLREKNHLEDLGVDVRIIMKWIFKKKDWRWEGRELTLSGSDWRKGAGFCQNGN
jgi:hypothetical protein